MAATKPHGIRCLECVLLSLSLLALSSRRVEAQPIAENALAVGYLEIVTPEVEATCQTYERLHGVKFGEPNARLGNARTARLPSGGLLGIRASLRASETPVVRPYLLVDDIEASVARAADSGAQIALPPMKIPGHGMCSIFIQGGIEHGLWQAESTSE